MAYARGPHRSRGLSKRVLYSPSTHKVITLVDTDLTGTIQLSATFRTERVIYAAPIGLHEMADSWSNSDIDDWEERQVTAWKDLAEKCTG